MYESDLTLFDEMGLIFYWSILLPILDAYTTFIILLMCSWISLSCFRVVSSGPMGAVTTPIPVSHLFQRHHHHHHHLFIIAFIINFNIFIISYPSW